MLLLRPQGGAIVACLLAPIVFVAETSNRVGIGSFPLALAHFYHFHPFFMATAKTAAAPAANKPVQAFRMRGLSVAVFANEVTAKDGRRYLAHNVSVQRTYRDGDEYKTTTVFRRDDLPILQRLMQQAWDYIVEVESEDAPDDEPE